MDNVFTLNTGKVDEGAKWVPKHLDDKVRVFFKRNPDLKSPIVFLLEVMNGQVDGARTIEDRIDAAKTLMPYFHSKAPTIEADEIKDLKDDVKQLQERKLDEIATQFSRIGLKVNPKG